MKKILLEILYWFFGKCAKLYVFQTQPMIIGVTGSVGKTSCRLIVTQVLRHLCPDKEIVTSKKNFNTQIGLVLAIFEIDTFSPSIVGVCKLFLQIIIKLFSSHQKGKVLVLEYGIDTPWDMKTLVWIAKPDIAIFTKLDGVHGAYFSSMEAIGDEKFLLMKSAKQAVFLSHMDIYSQDHYTEISVPVFWYDREHKIENFTYIQKDQQIFSTFDFEKTQIQTKLIGKENLQYVSLALQIAKFLNIPISSEKYTFSIDIQPWRSTVFFIDGNVYIDSTYNCAPESLKMMIHNTIEIKEKLFPEYALWFVLGDMRELDKEVEMKAHTELKEYIVDSQCVFTVWPLMQKYLVPELIQENYRGIQKHFFSSQEAWKELKQYLGSISQKFVILFKWSQNTIFLEEALKVLIGEKYKEELTRQEQFWMHKKDIFFKTLTEKTHNR